MKDSIKREQNSNKFDFAERENLAPKANEPETAIKNITFFISVWILKLLSILVVSRHKSTLISKKREILNVKKT